MNTRPVKIHQKTDGERGRDECTDMFQLSLKTEEPHVEQRNVQITNMTMWSDTEGKESVGSMAAERETAAVY